jgi:hypothetical protein
MKEQTEYMLWQVISIIIIALALLMMCTFAFAGGGVDYQQRIQQVQQVYDMIPNKSAKPIKATVEVAQPVVASTTVELKEPDAGDKIYVWLRTYVSGTMMVGFGFLGALTFVMRKFRKQIKSYLKQVLSD